MKTLLALLRAYQYLLSPWIGASCRFWPTCSEYAREAIETHGAARGSYMAMARLVRCHPYGAGGFDPVAARFRWRCWCAEAAPAEDTRGADRVPGRSEPRTQER